MARAKKNTDTGNLELLNQLAEYISLTKTLSDRVNDLEKSNKAATAPSTEIKKDQIVLMGEKTYTLGASIDGLSFDRDADTVLLIGKNGQLASGTRAPRTVGKGSAHFKAGAPSEANMPSSGLGSTRGVLVEGDGDDSNTFTFRAVSRMNRQGFNVFSDGSVGIGSFQKVNESTLGLYHRHSENHAFAMDIPSKDFSAAAIHIDVNAPAKNSWSVISVAADSNESYKKTVFDIAGTGEISSDRGIVTNSSGYAEYFEWADGNHRTEDRTGFAVTLDNGKLRVAAEGDKPIGVVVNSAAVVGNAAWNGWQGKYKNQNSYHVVEWLETENTLLKSYYKHSLDKKFALPDNAIEIQTDEDGNPLVTDSVSVDWDSSESYVPRSERSCWALVCLYGSVNLYQGQTVSDSWVKLKQVNDEFDLYLIK